MSLGTTTFQGIDYSVLAWNGEDLGRVVAIDTETEVVPFHMTPKVSTIQVFAGGDEVYYVPVKELQAFLDLHEKSILVMHNAPFDMDVLEKSVGNRKWLYEKYDQGLVRDTAILYRLWHLGHIGFIPKKGWNLSLLSEKFLGEALDKEGGERTNFAQFIGKDLSDIPQSYLEYGANDVIATFLLYQRLIGMIMPMDKKGTLLTHDIQVKGDIALNHIRKNGIGFNLEERDAWLQNLEAELEIEKNILATWGWVRGQKGIKDRYKLIMERLGILDLLPKTSDGSVSQKSEDLEFFREKPFVKSYLRFMELEKAASFVTKIESNRVHSRYNVLVNTGRTSCSSPNFQQLPKFGGIRELFQAREGFSFIITDYSAIELATLSQVTYNRYGHSVMRDKINEGQDLHKYYGTIYYNKPIDKITKEERQTCKAPNFGFPGGLGVDTFIEFSKGYGLEIDRSQAQEMKAAWFRAFPEIREYMKDEVGYVYTETGRKRANTTYCAEKNTPFQGLAADGAKIAMYEADKFGFSIVGFCHDELIVEVADCEIDEMLPIFEKIMIEGMKKVVPDVKIGVESQVSKFYTK